MVREGLTRLGTDSPSQPHPLKALPVSGLFFSVAIFPGCGFASCLAAHSLRLRLRWVRGRAPMPLAGLSHTGCVDASHHVLHMSWTRMSPLVIGQVEQGRGALCP